MFKPKKIDLSAKGFQKIFGELEAHIMEIVWNKDSISIKEVRDELEKKYKNLSFNSVMTVMNRLVDKGLLSKKSDRVSLYHPKIKKDELKKIIAKNILKSLVNDPQLFGGVSFVDIASDLDKKSIEKLKKIVSLNDDKKNNNK